MLNVKKSPEKLAEFFKAGDALLTPSQTAEILGVGTGALAVWRSTKRYPLDYVKVGRLVRYRQTAIDKFIALRDRQGRAKEAGDE